MKTHLALMLLLYAAPVHAQTAKPQSAPCLTEMYNNDGWKIPSLSTARTKERNLTYGPVDDVQVTLDKLEPRKPAGRLTLLACDANHPGRIELIERDADVTKILRFSANVRVFAYKVFAGQVAIEGAKRVGLGSMEILVYYDLDGSGKFKAMRYATNIPFKLIVPEWVKK